MNCCAYCLSTFVQKRTAGGRPGPGPLASFVRSHHNRGLDQYLLFHAAASGEKFGVTRPAKVWARALGFGATPSALSAVSKNWAWLEREQLIARSRRGRMSLITLLKEDGSGSQYLHPGKAGGYFQIPYEYWFDGWHVRLDLPTKAVLLIALSLRDDFILPLEHADAWYGLSSATIGRGLRTLRARGLLRVRRERRKAPLAPDGFTWEHHYTLTEPFGPRGRRPERAR